MDPKKQFTNRIIQNQTSLSRTDQKIADYLVHSYPTGLLETATEISKKLDVGISTVTRFFLKIGFKSIREAQKDFKKDFNYLKNSPLDRYHQMEVEGDNGNTLFDKTSDLDISNIQKTLQEATNTDIKKFVDLICNDRNFVYIASGRKTFGLSNYLHVQLNSIHPHVIQLQTDKHSIVDNMMNVQSEDVLIIFNFRRYGKSNQRLTDAFKKIGGKIIMIADSPISPGVKSADVLFLVNTEGVSILDSYTAVYFLINALLAEVIQCSGDKVRQRYEKLEEFYKQFNLFAGDK
jgi:DNA-binding MurR/RpiR family transcriptional regulator